MQRSTGVTVSAIFVFIGSGLTLLFGGFIAFAVLVMLNQPSQPPFIRYVMAGMVALYFVLSVWGIASGVGVLLLRNWARLSILIFSGILLFFALSGLLIVPFMPRPQPPDGSGDLVVVIRIFTALFYALFAAVGGGWIYFFNRRSVKEQFIGAEALAAREANPPRRPLSITIIGWILVVTSCIAVPFVLFIHYPTLLMGFVLTGWAAGLFMLAWCIVQGLAGVGLLRLRTWGRTLSICLFSFGFLNCAALALVPGAVSRWERVTADIQAMMYAKMGMPAGMGTIYTPEMMRPFMWIGVTFGLLIMGLQLWFVVSSKRAFAGAPDVPELVP